MGLVLLVTDRDLRIVGDPITTWRSLEAVPRFNEVGTGAVVVEATPQVRAQLAPGNRMVLIRDHSVFLPGPIEVDNLEWSVDGDTAGDGLVRITWASDLASIAGRVTYPNPAVAATAQDEGKRSFSSVNAETILRTLVDENAGPGALAARRVPRLALGDVAGVGNDVTYSTRFQPLADELRAVATIGGGLGFRTRQVADDILFEVYEPQNLSSQIRFSPQWGNLQEFAFDRAAPRVTTAIVGGEDADENRVIRERTDTAAEAAWGRIEQFIDRRSYEEVAELDEAGDEALADGGETARLAAVTVDTARQRFGEHYDLGDVVAVALGHGAQVADVVRAVHLQHTPDSGEVITAMVGSRSASADPEWIRQSRRLARQLARAATAGEIAL